MRVRVCSFSGFSAPRRWHCPLIKNLIFKIFVFFVFGSRRKKKVENRMRQTYSHNRNLLLIHLGFFPMCHYACVLSRFSRVRLCDPRLHRPWDSPGKNTGVGSHFLLHGIFPTQGSNQRLLHGRRILYG